MRRETKDTIVPIIAHIRSRTANLSLSRRFGVY